MEFGTREILIILGVVVIFGILLDGFRRVRRSRSGSLRLGRRKQAIFDDEDINDLPAELPTGEVRVKRRDERSVEQVSDSIKRYRERSAEKQTSAYRERNGGDHNVVPFQAEPAGDEDISVRPNAEERDLPPVEPALPEEGEAAADAGQPPEEPEVRAALDEFAVEDEETLGDPEPEQPAAKPEPPIEEDDGRKEPTFAVPPEEEAPAPVDKPFRVEDDERGGSRRRPFWEESESAAPARASKPETGQSPAASPDLSDVIILHVMAKKDQMIQGRELLEALLANHLRFGSMQIFHRHENRDGSGAVLFSLANSLNPGTFDLAAMEEFETPGVTLFMPLENLANPLDTYEELIKTAQSLAKSLNAVLQDETRSVLTRQTIEHYRQQIIEYTRRSFTLTN